MKNLGSIGLNETAVGDVGLANLKDCKELTSLGLNSTKVTDAGLAHLKEWKRLHYLDLSATTVSDKGMAHIGECKDHTHFANLNLSETELTDAGLAHLAGCKQLSTLWLAGTKISDGGLPALAVLPQLKRLTVDNTRISRQGRDRLQEANPGLEISWWEPNREVAEMALALGGAVQIATPGKDDARWVKVPDALPRSFFQVRRLTLKGANESLIRLLDRVRYLHFKEFDRLEVVDLSGTAVSDFAFLEPITGLTELTLARMSLNDDDLAKLPKLQQLKRLGRNRWPALAKVPVF